MIQKMKLTQKQKAEILKAYNACWDAYLKGDLKTHGSYLSDSFKIIGTSPGEQFNSKKAWLAYCKKTIKQFAGVIRLKNRDIKLMQVGDGVMVTENADIYVQIDNKWNYYSPLRISALLKNEKTGWKYIHQHGSFPDSKANEGEVIATEQVKKENLELRDAVKRRTIELEEKNRELEIETALEKVRAIALSMKDPADMLDVCKTIAVQLETLGVKEIRNVQTAIFYVEKGSYMNYEYYAKHKKTFITDTLYTDHKIAKAFAAKMLKGKGQVSITYIKGKEKVKDWIAYQKTTNVFIDRFLEKASSLTYYWHSLGPVALGISTYVPLNKDELILFQRFINVFELAYTRYLDIEQAKVQAREAQIEASLERVRARTMAMHKSDELAEVVGLLYKQFALLGFDLYQVLVSIFDPKNNWIEWWSRAMIEADLPKRNIIAMVDHPFPNRIMKEWKKGSTTFSHILGGKEKKTWEEYLFTKTDLKHFPKKIKDMMKSVDHVQLCDVFMKHGSLQASGATQLPADKVDILIRFVKVLDLAYTRMMDLQNAEMQTREALIEAALERVRSKSMAMHASTDLLGVINVVGDNLRQLGLNADAVSFITDADDNGYSMWLSVPGETFLSKIYIPRINDKTTQRYHDAISKGKDHYSYTLTKKEKDTYFRNFFDNTILKDHPQEGRKPVFDAPGLATTNVLLDQITLSVTNFSAIAHSEEHNLIIKRFAAVFQQSYTRFLDLQKAEAQAKEAQIEAALERVRSRSMGMQKSEELKEVIQVVYEQFVHLNIKIEHTGFVIDYKARNDYNIWIADPLGVPSQVTIPYFDSLYYNRFNEAKKNGEDFFATNLSFEEKNKFYQKLFEYVPGLSEEAKKFYFSCRGLAASTVLLDNVCLYIENFSGIAYTDEENDTLMRFGKVFQQTYTRFLDLQKAEAQSREAQIELGLERVRARAMAMQNSNELSDLVDTVFKELTKLDFALNWCIINIIDVNTLSNTVWAANPDIHKAPDSYNMKFEDYPFHDAMMKGYKERKSRYLYIIEGEEKRIYDEYLFKKTAFSKVPKEAQSASRAMKKYVCSFTFSNFGGLQTVGNEPLSDINLDILERFGKVFDLTYTRFNDLLKAEAQAKESQIQLALERVRARTMAMQHSDELKDAAALLFQQVKSLGVPAYSCGYNIWETNEKVFTSWMSTQDGSDFNAVLNIPLTEDANFIRFAESRKNGEQFFVLELRNERMQEHYQYLKTIPEFKAYFDYAKSVGFDLPETQIHHLANFSHGNLLFITLAPCPEFHDVFKRFAAVFEQTYTRFLDLQKAEGQARESQIQLALERVRARTMAMQKSDELREAVLVIYQQLQELDFGSQACNIIIIDKETGDEQFWVSGFTQEIFPQSYRVPRLNHHYQEEQFIAWRNGVKYAVFEYIGKEKKKFDKIFFTQTDFRNVPEQAKQMMIGLESLKLSTAFTSYGSLQVLGPDPLSEEKADILKRFAKVFEQTYTRFLDLLKAEAQSREAQIETAIEKVRSRSLAMHKSDEIQEVLHTVFERLKELNIDFYTAIIVLFEDGSKDIVWWLESRADQPFPRIQVPYADIDYLKNLFEAKGSGVNLFSKCYSFEEKNDLFHHLFEHTDFRNTREEQKEFLLNTEFATMSVALARNTAIHLTSYSRRSFSEEDNEILKRFAKVFDQAYTRFLDLQKAEAQAREAQIELALERVRARTMSMQKSDELADAAQLLYHEFGTLGISTITCGYMFIDEEKKTQTGWFVLPDGTLLPDFIVFPLLGDHVLDTRYQDWKKKKPLHIYEIAGEVNKEHHRFLSKHVPPFVVEDVFSKMPDRIIFHCSNFSDGYLLILATDFLNAEEQQTIIRFAKVFEMTYTRFLDLKKAEAQARESQIQLALERVRARTMAMQRSEELAETASVLFEQFNALGEVPERIAICIVNEAQQVFEIWATKHGGSQMNLLFKFPLDEPLVMQKMYRAWKAQKRSITIDLQGKEVDEYFQFLTNMGVPVQREIFGNRRIETAATFSKGVLLVITQETIAAEAIQILERFASVFDLTYTRFLDLQRAEAQTKESQIELGLERVRARAMAMQKSDELTGLIGTVFTELTKLDLVLTRCVIMIYNNEARDSKWWMANSEDPDNPAGFYIKAHDHPPITAYFKGWNDRKLKWTHILEGQVKKDWDVFLFSETELKHLPGFVIEGMKAPETVYLNASFNNFGNLTLATLEPLSEEHFDILLRFAKVFDLTYTRFNDLQKAEAQAREAKIEAALERVRYSAMAMQTSTNVGDATSVMFTELDALGIETFRCGIAIVEEEDLEVWSMGNTGDGRTVKGVGKVAINLHPLWKLFKKSWENKQEFLYYFLTGKEKDDYVKVLTKTASYSLTQSNLQFPDLHFQSYHFDEGAIFTFSEHPHTETDKSVVKRFSKVFSLTFRRYLDLKQAEAQAREAKIEASLERVRSKAMAMRSSQDLTDTIGVFYHELELFSITPRRCGVGLLEKETRIAELSTMNTTEEGKSIELVGRLKLENHPVLEGIYENWILQKEYHPVLRGQEIPEYYKIIRPQMAFPEFPQDAVLYGYFFFFTEGGVYAWTDKELGEDELKIYRRFTSVLSLTYKRYKELKEAEAQSKESQIQLALERVRARTMAMQKSEELAEAAVVLFQQFASLGETPDRISIGIVDEKSDTTDVWATDQAGTQINIHFRARNSEKTTLNKIVNEWKAGKKSTIVELQGQDLKDWVNFIRTELKMAINDEYFHGKRYHQVSFFSQGWLNITTLDPLPAETLELLDRFAAVFNLTYTRFVDLKKAETQTHKANIEVALERVRARALAMQEPEELKEVAEVLRHEMGLLGVEELETCSIYINDEAAEKAECWYALKDLRSEGKKLVNDHFALNLNDTWVGREMLQFYKSPGKQTSIVMQGANRKEWINYCEANSAPFRGYYGEVIPDRTYHLYKFSHGAIGAAAAGDISTESWELLQRAASVFSLAYSRFKDLTQSSIDLQRLKEEKHRAESALSELQTTQRQLIQSEKMASLGELTAGIAHEIQNPLNFVNNFSEVSSELIQEMIEEVEKGNYDIVKDIVTDIRQNLEKINHHGKRADGIVKGMLQHSRTSTGQKELTDINELADEYLRLAYHGLRAKDKSFNAKFETNFDPSIEKINILTQDMGRVILNLINNAFYTVSEKKKKQANVYYEPTVTVCTKKNGDKVELSVKDNGNGIPQKILDKIFQPFFTTKPTGQGTGLGLSLSYDIVKAHGGELKVVTKENEGSEFVIQIPLAKT